MPRKRKDLCKDNSVISQEELSWSRVWTGLFLLIQST